jgi:hypothetical protein
MFDHPRPPITRHTVTLHPRRQAVPTRPRMATATTRPRTVTATTHPRTVIDYLGSAGCWLKSYASMTASRLSVVTRMLESKGNVGYDAAQNECRHRRSYQGGPRRARKRRLGSKRSGVDRSYDDGNSGRGSKDTPGRGGDGPLKARPSCRDSHHFFRRSLSRHPWEAPG